MILQSLPGFSIQIVYHILSNDRNRKSTSRLSEALRLVRLFSLMLLIRLKEQILLLMNQAIFHFKRYEDSSLSYTGIDRHADDESVGGWDTAVKKKEYQQLFYNQQATMDAEQPPAPPKRPEPPKPAQPKETEGFR